MKQKLGSVVLLLAGITSLGVSSQAGATSSENSELVLHLHRTISCGSIVDDHENVTAAIPAFIPDGGQSGTASTGNTGDPVFHFTMSDDGKSVAHWEAQPVAGGPPQPVDFVMVEITDDANLFHYGDMGAISDRNLAAPRDSEVTNIKFCYGLARDPMYMGDCDDLAANDMTLNGTEVSCPDDEARFIISLDVSDVSNPDDRADFNRKFCSCNLGVTTCDPDKSRDAQGNNNACTNNPDGRNERPPMSIQGVENPGSYICFTTGGRRVCYGHF